MSSARRGDDAGPEPAGRRPGAAQAGGASRYVPPRSVPGRLRSQHRVHPRAGVHGALRVPSPLSLCPVLHPRCTCLWNARFAERFASAWRGAERAASVFRSWNSVKLVGDGLCISVICSADNFKGRINEAFKMVFFLFNHSSNTITGLLSSQIFYITYIFYSWQTIPSALYPHPAVS